VKTGLDERTCRMWPSSQTTSPDILSFLHRFERHTGQALAMEVDAVASPSPSASCDVLLRMRRWSRARVLMFSFVGHVRRFRLLIIQVRAGSPMEVVYRYKCFAIPSMLSHAVEDAVRLSTSAGSLSSSLVASCAGIVDGPRFFSNSNCAAIRDRNRLPSRTLRSRYSPSSVTRPASSTTMRSARAMDDNRCATRITVMLCALITPSMAVFTASSAAESKAAVASRRGVHAYQLADTHHRMDKQSSPSSSSSMVGFRTSALAIATDKVPRCVSIPGGNFLCEPTHFFAFVHRSSWHVRLEGSFR
jgi:hypothetical protein